MLGVGVPRPLGGSSHRSNPPPMQREAQWKGLEEKSWGNVFEGDLTDWLAEAEGAESSPVPQENIAETRPILSISPKYNKATVPQKAIPHIATKMIMHNVKRADEALNDRAHRQKADETFSTGRGVHAGNLEE
eukprot:CAMPEP_0118639954 /NCGR_PEP_ID=MMETSP0785-20121206/4499_1 /TAXON_ID=91992 /ORGANISM="Bolidomonas pacifica, Strain CCMP 1866" /LENGTH=132 /DNA_ID=CAMNT_0006531317 /DNA_START=797 /DNA_END=1192 /DNA_ORIENTATION=-